MHGIGKKGLLVPSAMALLLMAGLSASVMASPDERYGTASTYENNGRQVTTNFSAATPGDGGGNAMGSVRSGSHDDDYTQSARGDDDHDDDDDDDDHDAGMGDGDQGGAGGGSGGAGGGMGGGHDGDDGHDGGDGDDD
jgi:hypothetical protein